ncbi:MAG TPA: hypothetical protein VIU46_06645, partial [Gallionellaceae bacterium]
LLLAGLLMGGPLYAADAPAEEQKWYVYLKGSGCAPLSRLYRLFPYLDGKATPAELRDAMDAKYHDAQLEPFLSVMKSVLKVSGEEQSEKDREFFSHFTKTNAMVLMGNDGRVAIPLLTGELCATVKMLPQAQAASAPASAPTAAR